MRMSLSKLERTARILRFPGCMRELDLRGGVYVGSNISIPDGSVRRIGPTEVGLLTKRLSGKKLTSDNPVAFNGEAGYQAELLMPGLRWKVWPLYKVRSEERRVGKECRSRWSPYH